MATQNTLQFCSLVSYQYIRILFIVYLLSLWFICQYPAWILISQSRNTEYNRTISIDIMSPMVKPSYLHLLMYYLIVVLHWVHLDSTILDTKRQLHNQSPPQLIIPKTPAYTSYILLLLYILCVDVYCYILSIYLLFHRLNHPTQVQQYSAIDMSLV